MELTIIISIVSITIAIASFVLNRKDKSNQETEKDSYKWGAIDQKLENIEKTLSKIENKLDSYDREIEDKITIAMKHHINEFHKKG